MVNLTLRSNLITDLYFQRKLNIEKLNFNLTFSFISSSDNEYSIHSLLTNNEFNAMLIILFLLLNTLVIYQTTTHDDLICRLPAHSAILFEVIWKKSLFTIKELFVHDCKSLNNE